MIDTKTIKKYENALFKSFGGNVYIIKTNNNYNLHVDTQILLEKIKQFENDFEEAYIIGEPYDVYDKHMGVDEDVFEFYEHMITEYDWIPDVVLAA